MYEIIFINTGHIKLYKDISTFIKQYKIAFYRADGNSHNKFTIYLNGNKYDSFNGECVDHYKDRKLEISKHPNYRWKIIIELY
jgi:hypothetical protein